MSDPNARKILIVGDVRGRLDDLYKRVARVNKTPAGPFDALFCVGPFFEGAAEDAADGDGADGDAARHAELRPYVDGTAVAPVPTYFVEGLPAGRAHCRDPDGVVAPNITFLRHPKVSVVEGLRVAVLPGRHNDMSYADASKVAAAAAAAEGEHLAEDVAALRASHFADGAGVVGPPPHVAMAEGGPRRRESQRRTPRGRRRRLQRGNAARGGTRARPPAEVPRRGERWVFLRERAVPQPSRPRHEISRARASR